MASRWLETGYAGRPLADGDDGDGEARVDDRVGRGRAVHHQNAHGHARRAVPALHQPTAPHRTVPHRAV
eukprot:3604457-Prymnesium_polylepis.1